MRERAALGKKRLEWPLKLQHTQILENPGVCYLILARQLWPTEKEKSGWHQYVKELVAQDGDGWRVSNLDFVWSFVFICFQGPSCKILFCSQLWSLFLKLLLFVSLFFFILVFFPFPRSNGRAHKLHPSTPHIFSCVFLPLSFPRFPLHSHTIILPNELAVVGWDSKHGFQSGQTCHIIVSTACCNPRGNCLTLLPLSLSKQPMQLVARSWPSLSYNSTCGRHWGRQEGREREGRAVYKVLPVKGE